MQAIVNRRSLKLRSATTGLVCRKLRRTNPTPLATLTASSPTTSGDSHPRDGASFSAISSVARASAMPSSDSQSTRRIWPNWVCAAGTSQAAITTARMPGTTLTKNSQCHEYVDVIHPPMIGPTVGARTATTPAKVVASPCRCTGNSKNTAAKTAGIRVPPANPCSTRQAIRLLNPCDAAHPIEAMVNTLVAITNSQRIDSARINSPVNGIAMTSAIK